MTDNIRNKWTSLMIAFYENNTSIDTLKQFINNHKDQIDINFPADSHGKTAFTIACYENI